MVHKSKVLTGIAGYVDDEIVSKMAGSWKAWLVGGAAGIAMARAGQLIDALAKNPMVTALGLIQGENIDVEAIYAELLKQAQKGSATVELPVIGPITFGTADVESLYRHIMGA